MQKAAGALGLQIQVFEASTSREIDATFAGIARARAEALFVAADAFFSSRRVQFATLAARNGIPAACSSRCLLRLLTTADGTRRTCEPLCLMSAFGGKADIEPTSPKVWYKRAIFDHTRQQSGRALR